MAGVDQALNGTWRRQTGHRHRQENTGGQDTATWQDREAKPHWCKSEQAPGGNVGQTAVGAPPRLSGPRAMLNGLLFNAHQTAFTC